MNISYMDQVNANSDIGVLNRIISDMNQYAHNQKVQEKGCYCIWELGNNPRHKPLLLDHGVGPVLLRVLDDFIEQPGVLKLALAAIKNLEGKLYTYNKSGAGEKVLKCMNKYPHVSRIQDYGCGAIRTLATCRPNAEDLMKNNAGHTIVLAIHGHKQNEGVAKSFCGAVFSLALTEENREKIWKLGLMHFVLQAMQDHIRIDKIQEYGCGAIWCFGYAYSLVRLDAGKRLLAAQENHPTNARIAEYVCGALRSFAGLRINAAILMQQGAAQSLVRLMRTHMKKPLIVAQGVYALWSLCIWEEHKTPLMQLGIGHFLTEVLMQRDLFEKAEFGNAVGNVSGVITNLSTVKELAQQLVDSGCIKAVVNASDRFISMEAVQTKSVCAIRNLTYWDDNAVVHLQDRETLRYLNQVKQRYPRNQNIQRKVDEVLSKLPQ